MTVGGELYINRIETDVKLFSSRVDINSMTSVIKNHVAFLHLLSKSRKDQFTTLIKYMDKEQMKAVWELLVNIRFGNIDVDEEDKKKLHRKRKVIRKLTAKSSSQRDRRELMQKEACLVKYMINLAIPHVNSAD